MDPLLIEVPERIETERLILRCPRPGDGPTVNEAERETLQELKPWMPWAQTAKSLDESESYCRRMQARYLLREDLVMFIFERDVLGREGRFLGGTGLHRIDWSLPQIKGVPILTVSAMTERGLDKMMKAVLEIYETWNRRISTAKLNRWLAQVTAMHPPPLVAGRRIKIRYITQAKMRPPTFALFASKADDLRASLRKSLGLPTISSSCVLAAALRTLPFGIWYVHPASPTTAWPALKCAQ